MSLRARRLVLFFAVTVFLAGCTPTEPPAPPALSDEPVGVQLRRAEPSLAGLPCRVLLDFEKAMDLAFVTPGGLELDSTLAHTGHSALALDPNRSSITVKLHSLVNRPFPGSWTLVGAYFYAAQPGEVTVSLQGGAQRTVRQSRTVSLIPGKWTGVFLDLLDIAVIESPVLTIGVKAAGRVCCDDLLIVNNSHALVSPDGSPEGWHVRQRGLTMQIERPSMFKLTLKMPQAATDGWTCEEANGLRVRMVSESGKRWTIYHDGRQYLDGAISLLINASGQAGQAAATEQHQKPAELEIQAEQGQVDVMSDGDANNDGYNEIRGAYQVVAKLPRIEVKVVPRAPLIHGTLEVSQMPPGKPMVVAEGQLVERVERLKDGRLLVELPMTISKPTTVNIAVK